MKESLISDTEDLKNQYIQLKKICTQIEIIYKELSGFNFGYKEWKQKEKYIGNYVRQYEVSMKKIEQSLPEVKENKNDEIIKIIENNLENIKEKFEPMIKEIKERINEFKNSKLENLDEIDDDIFYPQEIDLNNNEELLEARRREFENMKGVYEICKKQKKEIEDPDSLEFEQNEENKIENQPSEQKNEEKEENTRNICCDPRKTDLRLCITGCIVICVLLILIILLIVKFAKKK